MKRLRLLYLNDNYIGGTLPQTVGTGTAAATLEQIYLQDNRIEGTVPSSLTQLTKLERLYLHNNAKMTGASEAIALLQGSFGADFPFSVQGDVSHDVAQKLGEKQRKKEKEKKKTKKKRRKVKLEL
jgi:hypothetical protein